MPAAFPCSLRSYPMATLATTVSASLSAMSVHSNRIGIPIMVPGT
jgi:hypothetical protein